MRDRLHLLALDAYSRLPNWVRRRVVRTIAPSYTVGAIAVVERPGDEVLLVRQVYRRHWGVPGGLVQRGEEPVDALRRELLEEIGAVVDVVGEPAVVVDVVPQRVDVVFRARLADGVDGETLGPESPEIAEVGWFPRAALPDLQEETIQAFVALARITVQDL